MVALNKIVWAVCNPFGLCLFWLTAGAIGVGLLHSPRWRKAAAAVGVLALAGLWFQSTPLAVVALGLPLERETIAYESVTNVPAADAIVLLGGGVSKQVDRAYPDLYSAADRLWHVARLYRAGKAPLVVVSGAGDEQAAVPLLKDLGIPDSALVVDNESRNTYENSRFTERLVRARLGADGKAPRVIVVTSAWHMPRALGNFSRTGLEAIPGPCDYMAHYVAGECRNWWNYLAPLPYNAFVSNVLFKEWLGKLARK